MSGFCPIKRIDHLEFYVGNAKQAAAFYVKSFGFVNIGYRGLETGNRDNVSYLLQQGDIRFLITSGLSAKNPVSQFAMEHGDGVAVIALEVPDAARAFKESTRRGALPAIDLTELKDERGVLRYAAIYIYGDTLLKFVERNGDAGFFAPDFPTVIPPTQIDTGVFAIDHIVGNVELGMMDKWAYFFTETMGFQQLVHFDDKKISTEHSALMSKVMQDGTGRIKFPINEPAMGKRKSQIQEFLEYYHGPGIQHVALATHDVVKTVSRLREQGVEFLRIPSTYYENLEERIGKIDSPVDELAELGILVDSDDEGYLLQIFTQPVQDRPTLFFEVIERQGSRGFGAGNFKSLFEAIEREQARRGNLM